MNPPVPVVLFAYARPDHLARVLGCLRENRVPLICAFADAAKGDGDAGRVAAVRAQLRATDWCELRLVERETNLGLGRNVIAGVTAIAAAHPAFVVWEDDLVCVPGTYAWMCAALRHFADDDRVMSVTAWTHPRVTPPGRGDAPYFDARAECWVWGAWTRSWQGMPDETAKGNLAATARRGLAPHAYGADLPAMAAVELRKNIWAVRWLTHHLARGKLCVRPPWSMVEHIGFDASASHASEALGWANPPLRVAPPVPSAWPAVEEHPACRPMWQAAVEPSWSGGFSRLRRLGRRLLPRVLLTPLQQRFFRVRWVGDHPDWPTAQAACEGYSAGTILAKVTHAARAVRDGHATYERDGVAFHVPPPWWPGLAVLQELAAAPGGKRTVLDFGGSLGSRYFQTKPQLGAGTLRWHVVEQAAFVEVGCREFQNEELKFFASIREACAGARPDVVLLASVLPYVPSPWQTLNNILDTRPDQVMIDRTGFTTAGGDRLTVQHVPRSIYRASYPCWFLDRAALLAAFSGEYTLRSDVREDMSAPEGLEFRSLHFVRTPA